MRPNFIRLAIPKSSWLVRGVFVTPAGSSGTLVLVLIDRGVDRRADDASGRGGCSGTGHVPCGEALLIEYVVLAIR